MKTNTLTLKKIFLSLCYDLIIIAIIVCLWKKNPSYDVTMQKKKKLGNVNT